MNNYNIYKQEIERLLGYCDDEKEEQKKEHYYLYGKRCSGVFSEKDYKDYSKCVRRLGLLESLVNTLKYACNIANKLSEVE